MLRRRISRKTQSNKPRARRLNLESLEPRQMLSASGFTTDYVKLLANSRAASSDQQRLYAGRDSHGLRLQQRLVRFDDRQRRRPDHRHHRCLQRSEHRLRPGDVRCRLRHRRSAQPEGRQSERRHHACPAPIRAAAGKWKSRSTSNGPTPSLRRANIVLVEANNASDTNLFAAVNYAREQGSVSVISMSWGSDDSAADASNDQALSSEYLVTPSGHQGITFVAASGDDGRAEFSARLRPTCWP